jgi:hypothetical protein
MHDSVATVIPDSPGAHFLSRTTVEKLNLVLGYLTAMSDVTNTLEAFRETLSKSRTAIYGAAATFSPYADSPSPHTSMTAEQIREIQRRHNASTKADRFVSKQASSQTMTPQEAMTDEEIGCILPDLLSHMIRNWDFKGVELAALVALVHAIYSEAENANVNICDVLEIARDVHLHRTTDAEAREKLKELRKASN